MMKKSFLHKMICLMAAAALVFLSSCALAQSAVIDNRSDPAGMASLREQPDANARTIGRFLSGAVVHVLGDAGNGWFQVALGSGMGSVSGYMTTDRLGASAHTDATHSASVVSPYGTQSVVLRSRPSNSYDAVAMLMVGDSVLVIGEMNEFKYVQTGSGCVGCLLASELK